MSYSSPAPPPVPTSYYSSTPPAPPPKQSETSTPSLGPPLPPPPPQDEPSELDGGQGIQYQNHYNTNLQPQTPQQNTGYYASQPQPHNPIPNIPPIEPNWLPPTLHDKSTADLHHLFSTPSLQHALLSNPSTTHPSIPVAQQPLRPLLEANLALTTTLSHLETSLTQKRAAVQSRLLALRALEQQHATKIAETETALRQFSPMALYQRLNVGVAEQEVLVKGLEESWLEEEGMAGEREVEAFVRRVKEGAGKAFLRRERRERWDEGRVGGWR